MSDGGVIWAVRYASLDAKRVIEEEGGKSIEGILAGVIDRALDQLEEGDWTSTDLARLLIRGLNAGASGIGQRVAENEVVRSGFGVGIPMVARLTEMAEDAWQASRGADEQKAAVARGRVRGLCQALAFVRSPTAWEDGSPRKRAEMVKAEEQRTARRQ